MRKSNERLFDSGIYDLIHKARMSDYERQNALNALWAAESIVDAMVWVKNKVAAVGTFFLKPSLRH